AAGGIPRGDVGEGLHARRAHLAPQRLRGRVVDRRRDGVAVARERLGGEVHAARGRVGGREDGDVRLQRREVGGGPLQEHEQVVGLLRQRRLPRARAVPEAPLPARAEARAVPQRRVAEGREEQVVAAGGRDGGGRLGRQ